MIAAQEYRVFRLAAYGGHLHIMESLIQSAPEKIQAMIAAQDYDAFKLAAQGGHLHIMDSLIQSAPEKIQEMIAAQDYGAFKKAAKGGHLHMIENLIQLAPEKVQEMIAAEQYRALYEAAESGHQDVVNFLLAYPSVFDYTQTPRNWFVTYVNPFVGDRLRALRAQKTLQGQDAPDAVFDITDANEIKLLCHFLKNLCERYAPNQGDVIKEPELRDDILFLLNIPSVMDSALQNKALIKFSKNLRSTTCLFQQCLFHHKSPGATGGATEMTAGPAQKK